MTVFVIPRIVRIVFLLLFASSLTKVTSVAKAESVALNSMKYDPTLNLSSLIQQPQLQRSSLFSHALTIIQSLETSPSCNRLAALALINSCQSLDMPSGKHAEAIPGTESILDEVRSEYAARLAMCELSGAKATLPTPCLALLPSRSRCGKKGRLNVMGFLGHKESENLCLTQVSEQEMKACLRSLESRPQWWTSYSNARQNAVIICQASRDAVEKEEKLAVYEALTQVASDIDIALSKSIKEANNRLADHHSFVSHLRDFQTEAMEKLSYEHQKSLELVDMLVSELKLTTQGAMDQMTDSWLDLESRIAMLSRTVQTSGNELAATRDAMSGLLKDVFQSTAVEANTLTREWQKSQQSALELRKSLDSIKGVQISALSDAIKEFHIGVGLSVTLMSKMHDEQKVLDGRLASLNDTIESVQVSAAKLKLTIDESSSVISRLEKIPTFALQFLLYLAFISAISMLSKRLAAIALIMISMRWIMGTPESMSLFRNLRSVILNTKMSTISSTLAVCATAACTWAICSVAILLRSHFFVEREECMIPVIEAPLTYSGTQTSAWLKT